jgi:hypothetical protein
MTPYVLKELIVFMDCLKSLRVPIEYCSVPLKHVAKRNISAMKAHDWHIFMQQLLPLCLHGLMDQQTIIAIMRLSRIFRCICAKVLDLADMGTLREDATITMCMLEMIMPPSFFDIMVHLILHLVDELDLCGLVHTRWMYRVEHLNKVLKGYVHNMVQPEASMETRYLMDETLGLIIEYMDQFQPSKRQIWDSDEEEAICGEVLEGASTRIELTITQQNMAHNYVFNNTNIMAP